jgi:hypothetical protein
MKSRRYLPFLLLFLATACNGQHHSGMGRQSAETEQYDAEECDTTKVSDFISNLKRLNASLPPALAAYQDSIAQQFIGQACEDDELFCGELGRKKHQAFAYNPEWAIYLSAYVLDEGAGMEEESASFFVLTLCRNGTPWFSDVLQDLIGEIQVEVNGFEAGNEQVIVWGHAYPYFQEDYGRFRLAIREGAGQYEFQCQAKN